MTPSNKFNFPKQAFVCVVILDPLKYLLIFVQVPPVAYPSVYNSQPRPNKRKSRENDGAVEQRKADTIRRHAPANLSAAPKSTPHAFLRTGALQDLTPVPSPAESTPSAAPGIDPRTIYPTARRTDAKMVGAHVPIHVPIRGRLPRVWSNFISPPTLGLATATSPRMPAKKRRT